MQTIFHATVEELILWLPQLTAQFRTHKNEGLQKGGKEGGEGNIYIPAARWSTIGPAPGGGGCYETGQ